MVELVDTAMLKVREFPENGRRYFDILSKLYLEKWKYTEKDMLEILNIERSCYYDRKREAVMIFGLAMWGTAIPKIKEVIRETEEPTFSGQDSDRNETFYGAVAEEMRIAFEQN